MHNIALNKHLSETIIFASSAIHHLARVYDKLQLPLQAAQQQLIQTLEQVTA